MRSVAARHGINSVKGINRVESVEEAKAELDTLPLVAAKLMTYELMPVTALAPFKLLLQGK
jgi:hypothetical protein